MRVLIGSIDKLLKRHYGIFEFTQDPGCVFRLAVRPSPGSVELADGTIVNKGEPVGEIHLWNERLVSRDGQTDWVWLFSRLEGSFSLIARHVVTVDSFKSINAFRAEGFLTGRVPMPALKQLAGRWGFEITGITYTTHNRFRRFFDRLYSILLIYAFNPGALKGRTLKNMRKDEAWISKKELERRYGVKQNEQ